MSVEVNNRVFVGNLAWKAVESELADFFSSVGTVEDVSIMRESHPPHRSRGYAFVSFETDAEASRAIEELNGTEHMGRELHINTANPRSEADTSRNQEAG